MKKSIYLFLLFCMSLVFASSFSNAAATKRVLVEEFTGAWCGYCVDGAVVLDQIIQANPGKVFGVKVHNGDAMAIPDGATVEGTFGVSSWPSGDVDRTPFNVGGNTTLILNRGSWSSAVSNVLSQPGIADIKLQWTYDPSTNKILANISAKFDQAVSQEIRFNVYVLEDKVTGTGNGYDQSNYYNSTSGHPMYGKGNPIVGYEHNETLRAFMGTPWGAENSIPAPISAGSTAKYSFEMPKNSNWNIDNIRLLGVVQYYSSNDRRILNVAEGEKVNSSTAITSTGSELFVLPQNETNELSINIKNNGSSAKEYTLSINKASGTTWNTSIEPNEYVISIPPAQTYNVKFRMTVNSTGSGQATLNIQEADGMSFSRSLKGYSADLSLLHVILDPASDATGLGTLIKSFPEYATFQAIPYADFLPLYSKFTNAKLVLYNTGDGGSLNSSDNSVLQNLINKKVNLVFTGPLIFKGFNDNLQQIAGQLGLAWNGMSTQGSSTQGKFNLEGISSDPISNGFSSQIQIYYYLNKVRITDPSVCSKIVTLQGNPDSIYAVKSQLTNSRAVCFGFHPMSLSNTTSRNTLIYNALKWVYASQPAEIPTISTPTGISFDEVATDKTAEKSFKIQNTGKKDLVISGIELKNNSEGAYAITDYGKSTITPGDSTLVTIKFAPSAIKFYSTTTVEISSNDPNKPKAVVQLSGKGGKPGNVLDNQIIRLNVSPSPLEHNGTIKFNIPDFAKSVVLRVVDINGRTILNLGNSFSFGENSVSLDSQLLNAGNYFVVLSINDENVNYKFTVIK